MGRTEQYRELLQSLKLSEEDITAAVTLAEKYPEIADGHLRQADYDRNMNQLKAEHEQWQGWYDKNKPVFDQNVEENTSLKQKLEELTSGKDVDMDAAAVQAAVAAELQKLGISNPTEKQINDAVTKVVDTQVGVKAKELENTFLTQTFPQQMGFMLGVTEKMLAYKDEFGKPLDTTGFAQFCATSGKATVGEAYEEFVKADRQTREHAKDIERVREEERTKLQNTNLPGSTAGVPNHEAGPALAFVRSQAAAAEAAQKAAQTVASGVDSGLAAARVAAIEELRAKM